MGMVQNHWVNLFNGYEKMSQDCVLGFYFGSRGNQQRGIKYINSELMLQEYCQKLVTGYYLRSWS